MANDPTNPEVEDTHFDGSEFKPYLVNLAPGELKGKRTARLGCKEVCKEILANQAEYGGKAGVTDEDFQQLTTILNRMARLDQFIQPVRTFLEKLIDTRYVLDDQLQRLIFNIATSVDRRSKTAHVLLGAYQLTRNYRSMIAKKGAQTRRKNEKAVSPKPPVPPADAAPPKQAAQPAKVDPATEAAPPAKVAPQSPSAGSNG